MWEQEMGRDVTVFCDDPVVDFIGRPQVARLQCSMGKQITGKRLVGCDDDDNSRMWIWYPAYRAWLVRHIHRPSRPGMDISCETLYDGGLLTTNLKKTIRSARLAAVANSAAKKESMAYVRSKGSRFYCKGHCCERDGTLEQRREEHTRRALNRPKIPIKAATAYITPDANAMAVNSDMSSLCHHYQWKNDRR